MTSQRGVNPTLLHAGNVFELTEGLIVRTGQKNLAIGVQYYQYPPYNLLDPRKPYYDGFFMDGMATLLRHNIHVELEDLKAICKTNFPEVKEVKVDAGEFICLKTKHEGGSTGRDAYPDGHHVYCSRLKDGKYDPDAMELTFYQTGCFGNKIENIPVIRKIPIKQVYVSEQ